MTHGSDEFHGFLQEVCETVERDVVNGGVEPDFEAMLARADTLAKDEGLCEPSGAQPDQDEAFAGLLYDVSTHLHAQDDPVPDFLAVVNRAHAMAPHLVPQSAVDDVGTYAPIIALQHVARLKTGQNDPVLDTFIDEVRGHVDHELVREAVAAQAGKGSSEGSAKAPAGLGRASIAIAAGLVLTLGLGAGLATAMGLGGGLWSPEENTPSEAMLSPRPAADQESELAGDAGAQTRRENPPDLEPELNPEPTDQLFPEAPRPTRASAKRPKGPSRRDRLAALEKDANAAWQAGKLDRAESAFRRIIAIDGRGSWGESAYGELFTLQRQRGRSSVSLWKAYLKRFPRGRFADDAKAGLCRRAGDDTKVACWSAYLKTMPRGSFRGQAQRELNSARRKDSP